jgi:Putative addiction module component
VDEDCWLNFSNARRIFKTMNMTVEQMTEVALALPSEARALLADRLVESLDPAEDGLVRQLWVVEARRRRDDVRSGRVKTIPGDEALAQVRRAVAK